MVRSSYVHGGGEWPGVILYVIHFDNLVVRATSTWSKDCFVSIVCYFRLTWSHILIWKLSHYYGLESFHFRVDSELFDLPATTSVIMLDAAIHFGCFPCIEIRCRYFFLDCISLVLCLFVSKEYIHAFTFEKASWIDDGKVCLNAANCYIVEELVHPL